MANALFISESTLKERSFISDNVDIKYLRETILWAQDQHIQRLTGSTLYELLKTQVIANTLTAANTTLINDYIQPILIWRVTAESAYWSSNKMMNKGVTNLSSENSQLASRATIDALANKANDKAEWYESRLVAFLCENEADYPTYQNPGSGSDVIHPTREAFTSAIFLGRTDRPTSFRQKYRDEQIDLN